MRCPDAPSSGTVASLSPASGAVFSLLPPDNATGNFTKIVQRLPVRIDVPADVAAQRLLRPACRSSSASIPGRSAVAGQQLAAAERASRAADGDDTATEQKP